MYFVSFCYGYDICLCLLLGAADIEQENRSLKSPGIEHVNEDGKEEECTDEESIQHEEVTLYSFGKRFYYWVCTLHCIYIVLLLASHDTAGYVAILPF